jgi:hypothetical protein
MSEIQDLLRQAMGEAPGPSGRDPLPAIRRAARLRQGMTTLAALAVAGAAIGLVITLPGEASGPRPSPTTSNPSLTGWPSGHDVRGVAVGLGSAWLGEDSQLVQVDSGSGRVLHRITVVGQIRDVAVGAGRVWVAEEPTPENTLLTTYDPATRHTTTVALPLGLSSFSGHTFFRHSLWLPDPAENELLRFTPAAGVVDRRIETVPGAPTSIAPTTGDRLWVQLQSGSTLRAVHLARSKPRWSLGRAVNWSFPLLGPAPRDGIWTSDGKFLVDLRPSALAGGSSVAQGYRLQTTGRAQLVATARDGIFVATPGGVDYFAWKAVRADGIPSNVDPVPAFNGSPDVNPHSIVSIAADGDEVLVDDASGSATLWNPRRH